MNDRSLDDCRWLTGVEAADWLRRAAEDSASLLAKAKRLRKAIGPERARLVLEQVDLRRRARVKFDAADRMFFLHDALEQATDQRIASYKAERFGERSPVADLCCGIGGDLMALAGRSCATGYERDPIAAWLAAANCRAANRSEARVQTADARRAPLDAFAAWHIDPDRRASGRRTIRPELFEPSWSDVQALRSANPHGAVKLAPASRTPRGEEAVELEWLGVRGECPQQVAWFGSLIRRPGKRVATLLDSPAHPYSLVGDPFDAAPAGRVLRWVYEPHPAVLAARLAGPLADQLHLHGLAQGVAYLTGDQEVRDPALSAYRVSDVLPFDLKKLRAFFRTRGVGRVEVKKRGVREDPQRVRKQLRLKGEGTAVLLLAPIQGRVAAIVAKRRPRRGGCCQHPLG